MFSHIATMLSFVYALSLTHVLASATDLVLARRRVTFSGLQTLWMVIAVLMLLFNWLSMWTLKDLQTWSIGWIGSLVLVAVNQYFICSLVAVKVAPDQPIDMSAVWEEQRPIVIGAVLVLSLISLVVNAFDPSLQAPTGGLPMWLLQDLTILPMVAILIVAIVVRTRWLQWVAGLAMLAGVLAFGASFVPVS